jgi:hypothetical protein
VVELAGGIGGRFRRNERGKRVCLNLKLKARTEKYMAILDENIGKDQIAHNFNDQIADILTKPLGPTKFLHSTGALGPKGLPDYMLNGSRKCTGQEIDMEALWLAVKRRGKSST